MTAAEKILKKALVASNIDSRQWNAIQAGLRDRAFFSSRVEWPNILDAARRLTAEHAAGGASLSEQRRDMRRYLRNEGYVPDANVAGTIKDLYSKARLDVIFKHNTATARGFVAWADGNTPGAYAAAPCQEFIRTHRRKVERTTWRQRWTEAGGQFYEGRMIAPKDSPVWTRLSVFGTPYPPFDWGSGMGVRDISRRESLRLGVITDDDIRKHVSELREKEDKGELPSMNGQLQSDVPATQDVISRMKADFGDLADIVRVDDRLTVKWRPEILQETVLQKKDFSVKVGVASDDLLSMMRKNPKMASFADDIEGFQLTVDQTWRDTPRSQGGTHIKHFYPIKKQPKDIPLKPADFEMLPAMWRKPDRIMKNGRDEFQLELDAFDGSTYCMRIKIVEDGGKKHPKLWTFFRTTDPTSKKNGLPKSTQTHLTLPTKAASALREQRHPGKPN